MKANLDPVETDKEGPRFRTKEVLRAVVNMINADCYFVQRPKMQQEMKEIQSAQEKLDAMLNSVSERIVRLNQMESDLAKKTKGVGSGVRDSAEKLSQGLTKLEKVANFDRLERLTALLERAAVAMTTLAELEKGGKLEKIASAIK